MLMLVFWDRNSCAKKRKNFQHMRGKSSLQSSPLRSPASQVNASGTIPAAGTMPTTKGEINIGQTYQAPTYPLLDILFNCA